MVILGALYGVIWLVPGGWLHFNSPGGLRLCLWSFPSHFLVSFIFSNFSLFNSEVGVHWGLGQCWAGVEIKPNFPLAGGMSSPEKLLVGTGKTARLTLELVQTWE